MAGLWLSIQLGMIIPTDEVHHFSEGWRKTTNQFLFCHGGTPYFHPVVDGLLKQPWWLMGIPLRKPRGQLVGFSQWDGTHQSMDSMPIMKEQQSGSMVSICFNMFQWFQSGSMRIESIGSRPSKPPFLDHGTYLEHSAGRVSGGPEAAETLSDRPRGRFFELSWWPGDLKKWGGTHSALFLGVSFYICFETSFLIPFFNFKGFDGCWVFWRCCGGTSWRVLNSWIFQLYFCIYKMVFSFLMFSDGKPHDLGCMSCILLVICLERRKPQLGMVRKLAKEIQTSVMLGSNTIHRWDVYAHGSSKDSVHLAFKFSGSWTLDYGI